MFEARAAPIGGMRWLIRCKARGASSSASTSSSPDRDAFAIVDLPDDEAAAAVSLIENAAGGPTVKTTVLLTPEQVDEAANRAVSYRPPGL